MSTAEEKLEAIRLRMAGHTDRREEGKILAVLAGASPEELDFLVGHLDLAALIADVDDHLLGPDHRASLLRLLCSDRLADLSVASRGALLDALQRGSTGAAFERAIQALLLGTRGRELTALKNLVDAGDSYRDLAELVFHDLDDPAIQASILDHFAREAVLSPAGEVKVLSDIDDTFYANWKDTRYPGKTVYPGVLALYAELDRGPGDEPGRAGDLTFVTARPGDRTGVVEDATLGTLRDHGLAHATVLTGSLTRLFTNALIAEEKLRNFDAYRRIFPEYGFVFLGDSGQGDVVFGQRMIETAGEAIKGIFIHDVVATPEDRRAELRQGRVYLFDTYLGAAVEAHDLGLIQRAGLARVAEAAMASLAAVPFEAETHREARWGELARDLERANERLAAEERVALRRP